MIYEGFSSERIEKCDLTVNDDHSTRFILHHVPCNHPRKILSVSGRKLIV
jgi:hypothetical protein